jgi:hypothetical protein
MTGTIEHSDLIPRWAKAGAGFNARPCDDSPDLERLLLDTARAVWTNARLFTMAFTWLSRYGELVAKNRLAALILTDLEREYRPVLGLLLDMVKQATGTDHFNAAIRLCDPAVVAEPLFEIERKNDSLRRLAQRRASAISRKWNLWAPEIELKLDALRPASWIMKSNAEFRERGAFKGDLRASVVAELKWNSKAGESESELARCIHAQRTAVRQAISDLELIDRVARIQDRNRFKIILCSLPAEAALAG